jgi:hypothetical protein
MDLHRSRRSFLVRLRACAAALPLAPRAFAQALPPLSPDAPQAKALQYTPDAATAAKNPAWKPGSHCGNCQFFTAATGACQIFPGSAVKPAGWCTAWAKRA